MAVAGYDLFAADLGASTADKFGTLEGGILLRVYDSQYGTTPLSSLYDKDDNFIGQDLYSLTEAQAAVPEDVGSFPFQAPNTYLTLWVWRGYGRRIQVWNTRLATQISKAIADASTALNSSITNSKNVTALTTRVDELQDVVESLGSSTLDITKVDPQFVTTLMIDPAKAMQSVVRDETTNEYFVTQPTTGVDVDESTILYRLAVDGSYLDQMTLEDAGHGTGLQLQYVNGVRKFWMNWKEDAITPGVVSQDLVRFEYVAGSTLSRSETDKFEVMPKFGGQYVNVAIDEKNDWIAYRVGSGTETVSRRKLSEVELGVDATYGVINYVDSFQGMATIDDKFYHYSGTGDLTDQNLIKIYSWTDGTLVSTVDVSQMGADDTGAWPGNYAEPEALSLFRDIVGRPHLLAGLVVGATGAREDWLFSFDPAGSGGVNASQIQSLQDQINLLSDDLDSFKTTVPSNEDLIAQWYSGGDYGDTTRGTGDHLVFTAPMDCEIKGVTVAWDDSNQFSGITASDTSWHQLAFAKTSAKTTMVKQTTQATGPDAGGSIVTEQGWNFDARTWSDRTLNKDQSMFLVFSKTGTPPAMGGEYTVTIRYARRSTT